MAKVGKIAIDLVLNTARFASDLNKGSKSTNKFAKRASKELKQVRKDFDLVAKRAAVVGTAAAAGFALVVKSSLASADAAQAVADKLGINVTKLEELEAAAIVSDVGINTLTMGLQRMTRRVSEAAQGTGEAQAALKELGIDAKALNKLSPDEQFKKIAEAMEDIPDQSDKIRLSFKLFDSEGVDMIRTLELGAKRMDEIAEEARIFGFALDAVDSKKLEDANASLDRAGIAVKGLGNTATAAIAPMLETITTGFADAAIANDGFRSEIQTTVELVIFAAGTTAKVFTSAFGVIEAGWNTGLGLVQTVVAAQLSLINEVATFGVIRYTKFFGAIEEGWLDVVGFANAAAADSLQSLGSLIISSLDLVASISPELAATLKADLAPALHDINVAAQTMGDASVKAFEDADAAAKVTAETLEGYKNGIPAITAQVQLYEFAAKDSFAAAGSAIDDTAARLVSIDNAMVGAMMSVTASVNTATDALKKQGDVAGETGDKLTAAQLSAAAKIDKINLDASVKLDRLTMDSTDFAIKEAERSRDAMIAAKGDHVLAEEVFDAEIDALNKDLTEKHADELKKRQEDIDDFAASGADAIVSFADAWINAYNEISEKSEKVSRTTKREAQEAAQTQQDSIDATTEAYDDAVAKRSEAVEAGADAQTLATLDAEIAEKEATRRATEALADAVDARTEAIEEGADAQTIATQDSIIEQNEAIVDATRVIDEQTDLRTTAIENGATDAEIAIIDAAIAAAEVTRDKAEDYIDDAKDMAEATGKTAAIWDALGQTVSDVAGDIVKKALTKLIEKLIVTAISSLGFGGAIAAAEGEATGGVGGAAVEAGIFVTAATNAISDAQGVMTAADGGPIMDLGRTGLLTKGTGPRSDDVLVRPNVLGSRTEFMVDAPGTAKNLKLLNFINDRHVDVLSMMGFANGGTTGGSNQDPPIGPIGPTRPVRPVRPESSGITVDEEFPEMSITDLLDAKATKLADTLLIGASIAFVRGWALAGDAYSGIIPGLLAAEKFAETAIISGVASKALAQLAFADGGETGMAGFARLEAIPWKFKDLVDSEGGCSGCSSGGGGCSGCSSGSSALSDKVAKRFNLANGGLTKSDIASGTSQSSFSLSGCWDLLTDPSQIVEQFWEGTKDRLRGPLMPITRELVSEEMFPDISKDSLGQAFTDIVGGFDPSDLLGDCGLADGGLIPAFADGGFAPATPGGGLAVLGDGRDDEVVMTVKKGPRGEPQLVASGGGGSVTNINVNVQVDNFFGNKRAIGELARAVGAEISIQQKRVFGRN